MSELAGSECAYRSEKPPRSARTARFGRRNSKFCDFMYRSSVIAGASMAVRTVSSRSVPSALHLVLGEPVRECLVARKTHELGCLGFVVVGLVHRARQVMTGNFLEKFRELEAIAQGPMEDISRPLPGDSPEGSTHRFRREGCCRGTEH